MGNYLVYIIQLDSGMSNDVARCVVVMVHVFYYSVLLLMVFVLWRFYAVPKDLGIVRKIRSIHSFFAPYLPSYYEEDDKE